MSWDGVRIGLPVEGEKMLRRRHHQQLALHERLEGERHVDGHLVAVEVGVVGGADERMDADGLALDEHGLEGLDGEAVQGGRAVEQHRVALGDLLEDVPDLGDCFSIILLAPRTVWTKPSSLRRRMMKGSKRTRAIFLGRPHWLSLSSGPMTMTERPE